MVLYTLACTIEGALATGLTLEVGMSQAREHNKLPGHDASCYPCAPAPV